MMKIDRNISNILMKMAEANEEYSQAKLAAAIVYRNKIIAFGINRSKSDPLQAKFGKNEQSIFMHAEMHAIKNALKVLSVEELKKCSMYVVRVKKPSQNSSKYILGLAKPCKNGCAEALKFFGFKNVVYSTDNQEFVCEEITE
jgi:tRNA(Arg) A34 adenosine deaminase TadA